MKTLAQQFKKLLREPLIDIILFGSAVKGKSTPQDLDVALLATKRERRLTEDIKKIAENADIQWVTLAEYANPLWLTLIREGFSVKHERYLHELYNITPVTLFRYSLASLTPSQKVMFHRGLKQFQSSKRLANNVILVTVEESERFTEFLRRWDLDIETKEYALMPLLRKAEF